MTPSESEENKNFTDSKLFHAEFLRINCVNRNIVEFATNVRQILNLEFNLKNRNFIIWMEWDGHEEKVADTGELEQCSSSTDVGWDRSGDLCTGSARPAPSVRQSSQTSRLSLWTPDVLVRVCKFEHQAAWISFCTTDQNYIVALTKSFCRSQRIWTLQTLEKTTIYFKICLTTYHYGI